MAAELAGAEISRKRGDTAPDKVTLTDPETGGLLDNSGFAYTLTINVKRNPGPSDAALVTITGIPGGANGEVEFPWTAMQADQAIGGYWYDIQQTDGSGRIKTIAKNRYIFHQDITK